MGYIINIRNAIVLKSIRTSLPNLNMLLTVPALFIISVPYVKAIQEQGNNSLVLQDIDQNIRAIELAVQQQMSSARTHSMPELQVALTSHQEQASTSHRLQNESSSSTRGKQGQRGDALAENGLNNAEVTQLADAELTGTADVRIATQQTAVHIGKIKLPNDLLSTYHGSERLKVVEGIKARAMISPAAADTEREPIAPVLTDSDYGEPRSEMDVSLPGRPQGAITKRPDLVALADWYRMGVLPSDESTSAFQSAGAVRLKSSTANEDNPLNRISFGQDGESYSFRNSFTGGQLFSLENAYTQKYQDDHSMPESDREQGFWNIKMSSDLLGPSVVAEFATSSFNADTSKDFALENHRMMKLATKHSWMGFNLGAGYQSVGDDFEKFKNNMRAEKREDKNKKDKLRKGLRGTELWLHRQFGAVGVKTFASHYSDDPSKDEEAPGFIIQKVGSAVDYQFSSWPQIGVNMKYASGSRKSAEEPAGYAPTDANVRDIESSVYYAGSLWSASLFTGKYLGADTTSLTDTQTYYAEASYFPHSSISISPTLSYTGLKYPEFDVGTDTLSSSLTLSYKPARSGLNYNLYGEYSTEKNLDWNVDNNYFYTSLGVNWEAKKSKSFIKQWSFDLFYDQYRDNIYRESNTGGPGFMLKLRSSLKPAGRLVNQWR